MTAPDHRALALRVARALRDRGQRPEAVLVLSAWAASGANDAEGQSLLAEALRIEPKSPVAQMAFERMEGLPHGDQPELDAAVTKYTPEELGRLDRQGKGGFQRAQVGFNNNVKYKGKPYHVQTEDSGIGKPHVITHLFADGGRIIKSHKRSYAAEVDREDVAMYVRALMKGQHMEMLKALRDGQFDPIIEGLRPGGMEVFETPPVVDVAQVGGQNPRLAKTPAPPPVAPGRDGGDPQTPAPDGVVHFSLHVLRSLAGGPDRYDPRGELAVIGSSGTISLPGERFCHPREALLSWEGGRLWLDDLEGGNGAFLRIRSPVAMRAGGEFVIGDQLLRLERNPEADDGPADGPTYFLSSLKGPSTFRVTQILEGGALGACRMARENLLQIGSALEYANDLVLHDDPLVSAYHCVIEEQADEFVLTDLGAKSGVFVRVTGRQALTHGDELLVGRTRLLVHLTDTKP